MSATRLIREGSFYFAILAVTALLVIAVALAGVGYLATLLRATPLPNDPTAAARALFNEALEIFQGNGGFSNVFFAIAQTVLAGVAFYVTRHALGRSTIINDVKTKLNAQLIIVADRLKIVTADADKLRTDFASSLTSTYLKDLADDDNRVLVRDGLQNAISACNALEEKCDSLLEPLSHFGITNNLDKISERCENVARALRDAHKQKIISSYLAEVDARKDDVKFLIDATLDLR